MTNDIKVIESIINDKTLTFDKSSLKIFLKSYSMFLSLNEISIDSTPTAKIEDHSIVNVLTAILKNLSPYSKVGLDTSSLKQFIRERKNKPDNYNSNELTNWFNTIIKI